jgi:hypothetical protein
VRRLLACSIAALGLAGCISNEPPVDALPVQCEVTADCDAEAGEVCDEGVCWGDPPDRARFAAILVPPAGRTDLPVAVLPELAIASDGGMAGIAFPEAILVRGRVLLACPAGDAPYACGAEESVGATIRVERASAFSGGPPYTRLIEAAPGAGPGQSAFSFLLPRDPDAEYRITIQPADTVGGDSIAPGEIAPPRQINLRADTDREVDWVLGDPADLKVVRGCVQNVLGDGSDYAAMRVAAFGRWTKLSPLERASSRSITGPDGCFELSVPRKMLDEFDITVTPAAGVTLPTYTLHGEFVRDPAEGEQAVHTIDPPLLMPIAPAPIPFRLPLDVRSAAGGLERVAGADVRLTTVLAPPAQEEGRDVEIRFTAQAVSSGVGSPEPGIAEVVLYPGDEGSRSYLVSVVPPSDSQVQSLFQREVAVGAAGGAVLDALTLERRIAVRGTALQPDDQPVVNAPMEARPSALFRLLLEQEALELAVEQLPVPTTTTDGSGGFVLWLDSVLVGEAASYDIDVTPPPFSGAPSWSFEDVAVVRSEEGTLDLGTRRLPEPSFARAVVTDQAGAPVPDAELHIYQLPPDDYCARQPSIAGGECEPTAKLRGTWRSDEQGNIRVVLPDP